MGEDCRLAAVERFKERLRSFLLASLQNFITAQNRRARAEKRGGRAEVIRLDWQDAETRLVFEPEDRLTPETLYGNWHCCFGDAPPSALSKKSSNRNFKNTNSSPIKEIFEG